MQQCPFKPKTNRKKSIPPPTINEIKERYKAPGDGSEVAAYLPKIYQETLGLGRKQSAESFTASEHPIDRQLLDERLNEKGMLIPKSMVNLSEFFGPD